MNKSNTIFSAVLLLCVLACFGATAKAQTTAFTYQGRFTDAAVAQPTNGTYQMQFKIYDQAQTGAGSQIENTVTLPAVQVVNGIFTVQLDFGARAFNGGDRFIEIGVQPTGGSGYTTLSPRQQVTNAPFAINSLSADFATTASNAVKLGNVAANNYTQNTDARLADDRNPTAGSANYIQNQQIAPQPGDFNIGGSGTIGGFFSAAAVTTQTFYRIGNRIAFSAPSATSIVAGLSANHNASGADNTFFGYKTGEAVAASAQSNTFIGSTAGKKTTTGVSNTFVGAGAGSLNTTGSGNSVIGYGASSVGDGNNVIGYYISVEGNSNTALGNFSSTNGDSNINIGNQNFANGTSNTIIGDSAGTNGGNPITHATAIGAGAAVSTSNTIVLGTSTELTSIPGTLSVTGKTQIFSLGAPGSTSLCRNAANQISTCTPGNFAENGEKSAAISALNQQNAEMKTQIERQQKQIAEQSEKNKQLQTQIDDLRKIFCGLNPAATVCAQ